MIELDKKFSSTVIHPGP